MTRLTAYIPQDELTRTTVSPEASTQLLDTLLEAAGATVIHGATVVVFDDIERTDLVIFTDGKVRELGRFSGEHSAAQRIVEAARGRESGPGHLAREAEHRPHLPQGCVMDAVGGPWAPYLVEGTADAGTWMAHDVHRDRFDARFTWAELWKVEQRCNWLNAHTDVDGTVWETLPSFAKMPDPGSNEG